MTRALSCHLPTDEGRPCNRAAVGTFEDYAGQTYHACAEHGAEAVRMSACTFTLDDAEVGS